MVTNRNTSAPTAVILLLVLLLTSVVGSVSAQISRGTSPNCPTLPGTVNVRINTWYREWGRNEPFVETVPLEDYVWGVVLGELHPTIPAFAGEPWAGEIWDKQLMRALSIAARTKGAYNCNALTDTWPQQYRPFWGRTPTTPPPDPTRFRNQSNYTKGMYLTWDGLRVETPFDGILLDAQYRSDAGIKTCSWFSGSDSRAKCLSGGVVNNYGYLVSNDNAYGLEDPDPNKLGPGPGFGQVSGHIWRKQGDKKAGYSDLLHKYYTGVYVQNDNAVSYTRRFYNSYNSLGCQGSVVSQSITTTINNFWTGSPAPNVNADNFCVRWTGTMNLSASDWYTIYVLRDDGMKVWVDDGLVLDTWNNSSPVLEAVSLYLPSGSHSLKVDYYDGAFDAVARFSMTRGIGMIGKYYNRIIALSDMPDDYRMIRPDALTQFDWVTSTPLNPSDLDPTAIPIRPNRFSIIWQGRLYLPGDHNTCELVSFKARVDDGGFVRLYYDPYGGAEDVVINAWFDQGATTYVNDRWLCGGTYRVEARYYEREGAAIARFWWAKTTTPTDESDTVDP